MTPETRMHAQPASYRKPSAVKPHPYGHALATQAIDHATRLAAAVRDEGPVGLAQILDPLHRDELYALALALAAMVPADVDPAHALAWLELPVAEWPADVLVHEAGRWDAGARDATALLAHTHLTARANAMRPSAQRARRRAA